MTEEIYTGRARPSTTGSGWTAPGSGGSGSGWSSWSTPHRAYRQPQLTDPEFGWREADHAVDGAVRKFGPAAVQRAVLASSR